jgi:hypothetical protein
MTESCRFRWLAWAIPTNLLMAKFPLAKYLVRSSPDYPSGSESFVLTR